MCGILGIVHREQDGRVSHTSASPAPFAYRSPDVNDTYTDAQTWFDRMRRTIIDLTDAGGLPDDVLARPEMVFRPLLQAWLSGVIAALGGLLSNGWLVRDGISSAGKADDVLVKLPARGWLGLFFAYKLALLEAWCQQVVAR